MLLFPVEIDGLRRGADVKNSDLSWSVPVMRIGFAGKGLVYMTVAGFSLYAIWRGGQAQSTESALSQLETTIWGKGTLFLIFLGMIAFAVWSLVDSLYDLDNRGTDPKGVAARSGMIGAALVHLAIGALAFSLLFTGRKEEGESSIANAVTTVMSWPGGRWIIGIAGLVVLGVGSYFVLDGIKEKYREYIQANRFTESWNWLLKAGVIARGIIIAITGALFVQAAWRADPRTAGGTEKAFSWLIHQPYGRVLVAAICVGLVGFCAFCFVSAGYRVIPKVPGDNIETLAARLAAKVKQAT